MHTKRESKEEYTMVHSIETKLNYFLMTYVILCVYICNAQCQRLPLLSQKTYVWTNCFFPHTYAPLTPSLLNWINKVWALGPNPSSQLF